MALTFPLHPINEIMVLLRQKVFTTSETRSITKNDLFPTAKPEVLLKIYMRVLQIVFGYRQEHFYMGPVNIDIQYFNIYEGFLPIGNVLACVEQLMPMCRVYDFQLADLISSKGKRTSYCLSGVLNFLVFRYDRRKEFLQWSSSFKSSLENLQQVQNANKEVEMKIKKLTTVPPEQQAEFNMLSSEINDLKQTLHQKYRTEDASLQEKFAQKKADYAAQAKRLSELKLAMANMREEHERMRSQIVESPEARKSKTENLKATVKKLKVERQETNENCEHYRERVVIGSLWQTEIQSYLKKFQAIETSMEKKSHVLTEIANVEDQVAAGNMELKSLSTEEPMAKRNLNLKKEKMVKLTMKIKKKHEDNDLYKQSVIEACNRIREKREAAHGRLDQKEREIQHARLQKKKLLEYTEEQKAEVQGIITSFKAGLEKYHDSLTRAKEDRAANRNKKIAELKRRI
ncbi:kinetochore protein Nuf2-A-like [Ambystoma mexicanum]|uniref:kinetochore protein Nuf2-A-like n=1 Tax=Ambystoma mexicanum TaxID=8296 RepID=UPI0037E74292